MTDNLPEITRCCSNCEHFTKFRTPTLCIECMSDPTLCLPNFVLRVGPFVALRATEGSAPRPTEGSPTPSSEQGPPSPPPVGPASNPAPRVCPNCGAKWPEETK